MDAYNLAYELLSLKVNFFEIYPKFFLELVKENNNDIYIKLQNINITNQDKEDVNKLIDLYLEEIENLRTKSDIISNLVGCNNDLGFFQEMMSDHVNILKSYKVEELNTLKYLSFDDVLHFLNLDKSYILKINEKYL